MNKLMKSIMQKHITKDTVSEQFCSDWLKTEILLLFNKIEELESKSKEPKLSEIENRVNKATAGPWGPYGTNLPFYAVVTKPAPSLSKHDDERATYWRIEDAMFVASAREDVVYLLGLLKEKL